MTMEGSPLFRFYFDNKKYLPGIAVIVGLSLVSGVLKMLAATYSGQAVDYGVSREVDMMLLTAGMMALFILLDCGRTALHYHLIGRITENMMVEVRSKAFSKLTHGDPAILEEKFRSGDMAARLNSDINQLGSFSAGNVSHFSRLIFSGLFGLAACIFMSWQLSLAYVVILPLSLGLVNAISKPIQAQTKKSMDNAGSAMSMVVDLISGALTVKAFGCQDEFEKRFGHMAEHACRLEVQSAKISMKMTGVKYLANALQTMSLFLIGFWLVSTGQLTVGTFIAFVTLSNYITEAFTTSDYMISSVRRVSASAQRYYEIMDVPGEQPGNTRKPASDIPCEARDLAFAYNRGDRVLNGLSLGIPAGKRVAVVGASGCGKSTLVKLLCRFYFPESGSLRLFGIDSASWDPDALRKSLAIVTQDSCLFHGSFYENVAYGRSGDVSREECEAALRDVSLWDFVSAFPDGMDHSIGEGGRDLSGGQKQRLCIARAMVKKAPLVILDEATSALDLQTEREVQKSLDRLLEGRSAIIIAHRLSTVQSADYIYCMDQGKVAEEGPPRRLLAQKGRYYQMCRLQGLVED